MVYKIINEDEFRDEVERIFRYDLFGSDFLEDLSEKASEVENGGAIYHYEETQSGRTCVFEFTVETFSGGEIDLQYRGCEMR